MESPEKRPERELLHFLTSWEMLIVQGVSVALVALSPDDVLARYPSLAVFVSAAAEFIRPISAYQRVSDFPQVSGLYFSVMFFVTPLMVLYSWRMRSHALRGITEMSKKRPMVWFVAAISTIVIGVITPILLYVWANGSEVFPSMPMRSSKMSLALLGWLAAGGLAWGLATEALFIAVVLMRKLTKLRG
jgi:hypothetical protein